MGPVRNDFYTRLVRRLVSLLAVTACSPYGGAEATSSGSEAGAPDGGSGGTNDGGASDDGGAGTDGSVAPGEVPLASAIADPVGLAVTDTHVYFSDRSPGYIRRVAFAKPGVVETVANDGGSPGQLAILGNDVYWSDYGKTRVRHAALAANAAVLTLWTGTEHPVTVLTSTSQIAFATIEGNVYAMLPGDTDPTKLGAAFANPNSLAFHDAFYVCESGNSTVWLLAEPSNQVVSSTESDCAGLVPTSSALFWTRKATGDVRRSPYAALGPVPTSIVEGEAKPLSLAGDDKALYWLTGDGRLRMRDPTGTVTTVSTNAHRLDEDYIRAVAVTAAYVVWIDYTKAGSRIFMRAR